jgi:hypothetical protein
VASDGLDFAHAMGRIYDLFTNLKHCDLLAADRLLADLRIAADIELATDLQKKGADLLRLMGRITEI